MPDNEILEAFVYVNLIEAGKKQAKMEIEEYSKNVMSSFGESLAKQIDEDIMGKINEESRLRYSQARNG